MSTASELPADRPHSFEDRYRLYVDESGDHVFHHLEKPSHRFLCLLGCWFRNPEYLKFHDRIEAFKKKHIPHHPDDPPILHREDIINRRGYYTHLQDAAKAQAFDDALLEIIREGVFSLVAVVIDKLVLQQKYGDAVAHPYHLAMGFMLQRYCGYLNQISRVGDVMAESRGGREDRLLADSYSHIHAQGVWQTSAEHFQRALTSKQLKIKNKSANTAGLQLADLLCHPARQAILKDAGFITEPAAPFAARVLALVETKWNRHLYDGRIEGYGKVLYPK